MTDTTLTAAEWKESQEEKEYLNVRRLLTVYDRVMELDIYVGNRRPIVVPEGVERYGHNVPSLYEIYTEAAEKHRTKIDNDIEHIDAGFDVFVPEKVFLDQQQMKKVNFQIKCRAKILYRSTAKQHEPLCTNIDNATSASESKIVSHNTGFYMYPRSSLSKTPLRLANATGIIDAGYRGDLIGVFDVVDPERIVAFREVGPAPSIARGDRLVQICAPGLIPIVVNVYQESELSSDLASESHRGDGGFGSTGR